MNACVASTCRTALMVSFAITTSLVATQSSGGIKVAAWIDPGHGANDDYYGAPCFNDDEFPDEKDLNLQVAQRVRTRLAQIGYFAYLTRNDDRVVGRTARTRMAAGLQNNHAGEGGAGIVFVSIHMDGDPNPNTHGTFIMYPSKYKTFKKTLVSYRVDSTLASWINPPPSSPALLPRSWDVTSRGRCGKTSRMISKY